MPASFRVRRLLTIALAALAVPAVVVAAVAATGSTGASKTTRAAPDLAAIGTFAVATTTLSVEVPGLAPGDNRLPTTVWYPLVKPASVRGRDSLGPSPLLVFSEGFGVPVSSYSALIEDWASAGFVVAGPTYPHTSPSTATTLDRGDLVHHPADLHAVIEAVLGESRTPGSVLYGRVEGSGIGLVGQSDGGDVSLAVADDSCCRYAGVSAVAILSGAEYAGFGGRYFAPGTPPGPPLLVVQGQEDTINPPVCSVELYDAAAPPKYYLDLLDGTHLGPYTEPTAARKVVAAVTTAFFEATLGAVRGPPEKKLEEKMAERGDVPGVAQLTTSQSAPPASGTCPTAP